MQKHDFTVFLELWNITQGYTTPSIHLRMAEWLQTSWRTGDTQLLLIAFRASGKSTLVGIFIAWVLCQDPECRFLVLAAESSLASKMVRNIRKTIEKHPLTAHLIPNKPDQWAADRFTVNRHKELRDPSVLAAGITANVTGCRADIIIYDDVEVPNTSSTLSKRQALRERLSESNFILVPGGIQLYVGTPHTYFSIYAENPRLEANEENIFLSGYKRLKIPVLNSKKQSAWPEKYTKENIELIKKQSGPHKFASQMLLKPVNILQSRLNTDLLSFYDGDLVYEEANKTSQLYLNGKKLVSCSAWWDPAFGSKTGDRSVFAVVFTDEAGCYYLHHLDYITVNAKKSEDEASLQCQRVTDTAQSLYVPSITIETNGIGKFLPSILRRELALKNVSCAVNEYSNYRPKYMRILEAFDVVMAARSLYVHRSIRETPFLTEMTEWQPQKSGGYDDGLDAVAGALSLEPVRLKRYYASNHHKNWQKGSHSYAAQADFDV